MKHASLLKGGLAFMQTNHEGRKTVPVFSVMAFFVLMITCEGIIILALLSTPQARSFLFASYCLHYKL